jgi:hypothetical protein
LLRFVGNLPSFTHQPAVSSAINGIWYPSVSVPCLFSTVAGIYVVCLQSFKRPQSQPNHSLQNIHDRSTPRIADESRWVEPRPTERRISPYANALHAANTPLMISQLGLQKKFPYCAITKHYCRCNFPLERGDTSVQDGLRGRTATSAETNCRRRRRRFKPQ